MLTYFYWHDGHLTQHNAYVEGCWINLTAPEGHELLRVSQETAVPLDLLRAALDLDERARVERDDRVLLIVLQTPLALGGGHDLPFDTVPLGIVHAEHALITVTPLEHPVVQDVLGGSVRTNVDSPRHLTFALLLRTAQRFLLDVRRIDRLIEQTEDLLRHATRNQELLTLLHLEKSLVYFATALKANEAVLRRLRRDRSFTREDTDEDLLDDVLIENQQATEMTLISTQILASLLITYGSVINNNVARIVRLLTGVTILLTVPTLIASIYGMNVPLPDQEDPRAFAEILVLMLFLSGVLAFVFRRLRWF